MSQSGRSVMVIAVACMMSLSTGSSARADDWLLAGVEDMMSLFKHYLPPSFAGAQFSATKRGNQSVLIMKLGMGIAYCKGHAATIGQRKGRGFQAVAVSRTMRGVRSRNIGLTATKLPPGTYHIVHGSCHVGNRVYQVGGVKTRANGKKYFTTSYARFVIREGEVLNAGFLRFFPPYRGRGGPKIRLQAIPAQDLSFLANRYRSLRADLRRRLMRRTTASGDLLGARRKRHVKQVQRRKTQKRLSARRVTINNNRSSVVKRRSKARVKTAKRVVPVFSPPEDDFDLPPIIKKPKPAPIVVVPKTMLDPLLLKPLAKSVAAKPVAATPSTLKEDKKLATVKQRTKRAKVLTTSMSLAKRREACKALLQLKREGKVQQLPLTCLHVGLSGLTKMRSPSRLAPLAEADK